MSGFQNEDSNQSSSRSGGASDSGGYINFKDDLDEFEDQDYERRKQFSADIDESELQEMLGEDWKRDFHKIDEYDNVVESIRNIAEKHVPDFNEDDPPERMLRELEFWITKMLRKLNKLDFTVGNEYASLKNIGVILEDDHKKVSDVLNGYQKMLDEATEENERLVSHILALSTRLEAVKSSLETLNQSEKGIETVEDLSNSDKFMKELNERIRKAMSSKVQEYLEGEHQRNETLQEEIEILVVYDGAKKEDPEMDSNLENILNLSSHMENALVARMGALENMPKSDRDASVKLLRAWRAGLEKAMAKEETEFKTLVDGIRTVEIGRPLAEKTLVQYKESDKAMESEVMKTKQFIKYNKKKLSDAQERVAALQEEIQQMKNMK